MKVILYILCAVLIIASCSTRKSQSLPESYGNRDEQASNDTMYFNFKRCMMEQQALHRIIYLNHKESVSDYEHFNLIEFNSKYKKRDTICINAKLHPQELYNGRNDNEIIVFSKGGSDQHGLLTIVDLEKKREDTIVSLGHFVDYISWSSTNFSVHHYKTCSPNEGDSAWVWVEKWNQNIKKEKEFGRRKIKIRNTH